MPEGARLVGARRGISGSHFPQGFLAGGVVAGLKKAAGLTWACSPSSPWRSTATSAAVFTTNAFAAAPIIVNRTECDLEHLMAVAMNSGNANACTGDAGIAVARAMQSAAGRAFGLEPSAVAVGSTGIIGVQLDAEFMASAVARPPPPSGRTAVRISIAAS